MIAEPRFFRTELLEDSSTVLPERRSTTTPTPSDRPSPDGSMRNGKQGGDPQLAAALIKLAELDQPRSAGSSTRHRRTSRRLGHSEHCPFRGDTHTARTYQRVASDPAEEIARTEPAIARCADHPITTAPASRDSILDVPLVGTLQGRVLASRCGALSVAVGRARDGGRFP